MILLLIFIIMLIKKRWDDESILPLAMKEQSRLHRLKKLRRAELLDEAGMRKRILSIRKAL